MIVYNSKGILFPITILFGIIHIFSVGYASETIQGKVDFIGKKPGKNFLMEIVSAENPVKGFATWNLKESGEFSVDINAQAGEEILIYPMNSGNAFHNNTFYYMGYARHTVGENESITVELTAHRIREVPLKLVDQNGDPAQNIPVSCGVKIPICLGKRSWKRNWKAITDEEGVFFLRCLPFKVCSYSVMVNTYHLSQRNYYLLSTVWFKGSELLQTADIRELEIRNKILKLIVDIKWDPDFSLEKFPKKTEKSGHALKLTYKGKDHSMGGNMNERGTVLLYDMKPGTYELEFYYWPDKRFYTITQKTSFVRIPHNDAELPVRHTMFVRPRKAVTITGRVIDGEMGLPVKGVSVRGGAKHAVSNSKGIVTVEILKGLHKKLLLSHPDYYNQEISTHSLKDRKGMLKWVMRPHPKLQGQVLTKADKKGVSWAKLFFRNSERSEFVRCDRKGRFSIRLIPGEYSFRIEAMKKIIKDVQNEDNVDNNEENETSIRPEKRPPEIILVNRDFDMPEEGLRKDFLVSDCVDIDINVTFSPGNKEIQSKEYCVALLNAENMRLMGVSMSEGEANSYKFYVPEGLYKVMLVSRQEQRGVIVGERVVKKGLEKKNTVTVEKPMKAFTMGYSTKVTFQPTEEKANSLHKQSNDHNR